MNTFTAEYLSSTTALRASAAAWDDLWLRSQATLPTSRAELVAQWIDQFAPRSSVQAIVVRQRGEMVAALPLFASGPLGLKTMGRLPGNAWSPAGELLLDPAADGAAACDQIVAGLRKLRLPIVLFEGVNTGTHSWQQFSAALERNSIATIVRPRFRVEQVEIAGNWKSYLAERSRSHRRQIRRSLAKAEAAGTLRLRILDQLSQGEIAKWLRAGLEMEDRGWKGAAAGSALKAPGLFDYYLSQAQQLAKWGQLQLVFLELEGQPIAFEYGWMSKGIYYSPKVAYDEAFGQFSPGQLLRAALLERFQSEAACKLVDYLGPSSRATAGWSTRSYPVSRVILGTNAMGRASMAAYEFVRPLVKRFRGRAVVLEPGDPEPDYASSPTAETESPEPAAV